MMKSRWQHRKLQNSCSVDGDMRSPAIFADNDLFWPDGWTSYFHLIILKKTESHCSKVISSNLCSFFILNNKITHNKVNMKTIWDYNTVLDIIIPTVAAESFGFGLEARQRNIKVILYMKIDFKQTFYYYKVVFCETFRSEAAVLDVSCW